MGSCYVSGNPMRVLAKASVYQLMAAQSLLMRLEEQSEFTPFPALHCCLGRLAEAARPLEATGAGSALTGREEGGVGGMRPLPCQSVSCRRAQAALKPAIK